MVGIASLRRSTPGPSRWAAVWSDPPVDAARRASSQGIQFESMGNSINGMLYEPAGADPHPTIVLLHGLPGNEQNLDLAQIMRRAGFTVITFHYRGSWGSGGCFKLTNGAEDAEALIAELRKPGRASAWGVDPGRIVLVGHSYGGWVAASILAHDTKLSGAALIAPWDVSYDA